MDCARVLLRGAKGLEATDVGSAALSALRAAEGRVRAVHVVARRGPVQVRGVQEGGLPEAIRKAQCVAKGVRECGCSQAACSPKELKELTSEPDLAVCAPADQMVVSEADEEAMRRQRPKRRMFDIIKQVPSVS